MTNRPAHSPLGASGSERWMNCAGSVALLSRLDLPQSDDPDYRTMGTSAHSAGYKCLSEGLDAWEVAGEKFEKHECDADMAGAVQTYLDHVRSLITEDTEAFYEFGVDAPDFHKDFYGTLDCGLLHKKRKHLDIIDYKHGEGIAVDVEWNSQLMYYAFGKLRHHPDVETVTLYIVQPRAFHENGPIRKWETTADTIRRWAEDELLPAMLRTEMDNDLNAGSWCRFCPAKLICPLMTSLFGAAMQADPAQDVRLSDEALGRSYQYVKAVEQYIKALKDEVYRRLMTGSELPSVKLVNKKANRVWKAGADKVFLELFPKDAMTEPKLKSPAEMEKISPTAKTLVHQHAYTPDTGLTVALASDKAPAVKVTKASETFAGVVAQHGEEA